MQFSDQHIEAIAKTIRVKDEVGATVFCDKVKPMGSANVTKGRITIAMDYVPGMASSEAQRDFLMDAISLALKACYDARPQAFDPQS